MNRNIPPPPPPTTLMKPSGGGVAALLPLAVVGLALVLFAMWMPVSAQQPAAVPEYSITLNGQEWFQIGEALSDRPFKVANPILLKINQQVNAIAMQRQKEAEEKAKADAEQKKPE